MTQNRNLSGCQIFHASELPEDWNCVLLGERLELAYGRALHGDDRCDGDVDVFGSNGKVGIHNVRWLEAPGVLVGRKGSVGAVHYATRPYWPIDTAYYVKPLANDNLRFLYYLLEYLRLDFLNAATGVPGLSRRDAYALRGAFPNPGEETAIARVLDAVDTALEHTRTAIARARDVKKSLVQELFSKGTRNEPQRKTGLGYIPRSWEVVSVESVVLQFQYGLSVPMQQKGAIPILRMGNIQSGDVVFNELKYVTLPERETSPYIVKKGDVLFNRTNSQEWVGKVGIYRLDLPVVFASYLIRVVPDPQKADNYFLGQLLDSYPIQCRIKRYATPGVQQVNINATNLGKVLIPMPTGKTSLAEQREIAAILESADKVIRDYEPVLAAQHSLKKSLTHDLLTGRVRVPLR